jgi:tetratricopeptide (TPR) repeat protein
MRTLGVAILVCAAPLGVRAAAGVHEAASRAYAEAIAERDAGDPQAAIAKLRQVLDLVPDSGESYWALAWILDSQAQEKEACEAWRKASELLPAGDPRRADAKRYVARLDRLFHSQSPRDTPPTPGFDDWLPTGWALGGLLLLGLWCGAAAAAAAREDRALGADSPPARFVRLCDRLRRGDDAAGRRLVQRAASGFLDGASEADFVLLLKAAARHDEGVREALARLATGPDGAPRRWAEQALAAEPPRPAP